MDRKSLKLATRGSALAVAQSTIVAKDVERLTGLKVELVLIKTKGDMITDRPLELVGGKGLFTKEIEVALQRGDADFAVHSMKDLPAEMPEGLVIGAVPLRADPRDVLIGGILANLTAGTVIGTGSARRRMQLRAVRPDLEFRDIRGNVDTRINKQRSGEFGAIMLAAAGLARLGRTADADEFVDVETVIPAPGQGALALQCREQDAEVRQILGGLHDFATGVCVEAERAFLKGVGGGCSVPAAAFGAMSGDGKLRFLAFFAQGDEGRRTAIDGDAEDAVEIGSRAAADLRG